MVEAEVEWAEVERNQEAVGPITDRHALSRCLSSPKSVVCD
jgi:hypothetical protein